MIDKASASGINFHHLKVSYLREGGEGVLKLFTEDYLGKPRVTKRKNILESVVNFFNNTKEA